MDGNYIRDQSDDDKDLDLDHRLKVMRKKRSLRSQSPGFLTVGEDSRRQSTVFFDNPQSPVERPEPPENYFIKVHLKTTFGYRKKLCLLSNGMLYLYTSYDKVRKHKPQFTIDLGTCIISYNAGSSDSVVINDDEEIFCLKVKEEDKFMVFLESVQKHKVYQQDYLAYLNAEQRNNLDMETGSLVASRKNSGHIVQDVKIAKPNVPDKVPVEYKVSKWLQENKQPLKGENPEIAQLKVMHNELLVILDKLDKLTDMAADDMIEAANEQKNKIERSKFRSRWSFRFKRSTDDEDPDHPRHNMPVTRKSCSVSASSPEINLRKKSKHYLSSTSFAAADVSRRKSKDKLSKCYLKREMSDWYHKNTYAREEFLRLAKELSTKISDVIQNLSIQCEASDTVTSAQIATVADEIISTFKPQQWEYELGNLLQEKNFKLGAQTVKSSAGQKFEDSAARASPGRVTSVFNGRPIYPDPASKGSAPNSAPVLLSPADVFKQTPFRKNTVPPVYIPGNNPRAKMSLTSSGGTRSDDSDFEMIMSPADMAAFFRRSSNAPSRKTSIVISAPSVDYAAMNQSQASSFHEYRTRLPKPMPENSNVSTWSVLKTCIGKDLNKISFPIEMYEPLSLLQVLCEELQYAWLLDKAAETSDAYMRMVYVTAFAISRYASMVSRVNHKPFSPLVGETFSCNRPDLGWKFMAEHVSQQPSVSACHATGQNWELYQNASFNLTYWGKSVQAEPTAPVWLQFNDLKEIYQWNKVTSSIHNLISGRKYVDHRGEVLVKSSSGVYAKVHFKKSPNGHTSEGHNIEGKVYGPNGSVIHILFGNWTSSLSMFLPDGSPQEVWRANPLAEDAAKYYGFNALAMCLNEIPLENLPPTDCRFRPDMRALENGDLQEAGRIKQELESQRKNSKKSSSSGSQSQSKYQAKWFKEVTLPSTDTKSYKFNYRYWSAQSVNFQSEDFVHLW